MAEYWNIYIYIYISIHISICYFVLGGGLRTPDPPISRPPASLLTAWHACTPWAGRQTNKKVVTCRITKYKLCFCRDIPGNVFVPSGDYPEARIPWDFFNLYSCPGPPNRAWHQYVPGGDYWDSKIPKELLSLGCAERRQTRCQKTLCILRKEEASHSIFWENKRLLISVYYKGTDRL